MNWELLIDVSMVLMVVIISWVDTYPKLIELYLLNIYSFFTC